MNQSPLAAALFGTPSPIIQTNSNTAAAASSATQDKNQSSDEETKEEDKAVLLEQIAQWKENNLDLQGEHDKNDENPVMP